MADPTKQNAGAVEKLTSPTNFVDRAGQVLTRGNLPETQKMMLEGVTESAKAKGLVAQKQAEREAKLAGIDAQMLQREADEGQRLMEQAKTEREARRPVFEPTKDNFKDFAAMFSVISAMTFAIGGKGRGSGMAALSALNGALDGWNKGRKDVFDKNIREYKMKLDEYKTYLDEQSRDLKLAIDLGGKKTAAGRAQLKEVVLKDTGGLIAAQIDSDRIDGAIRVLGDVAKGLQQVRAIEARAAATAANRTSNLNATERKEKTGAERLLGEMKRLRDSFKPEYANKKFDTVGELMSWTRERMLNDPKMAIWWKQYENVAMPERHAMFGATLTGGERDAWRRASIGSGNSTAVIKDWFDDRIRLLEVKLDQFDRLNETRAAPYRENDPLGIMQ